MDALVPSLLQSLLLIFFALNNFLVFFFVRSVHLTRLIELMFLSSFRFLSVDSLLNVGILIFSLYILSSPLPANYFPSTS